MKRKYDANSDPAPRGTTRAVRRRFREHIDPTPVAQIEGDTNRPENTYKLSTGVESHLGALKPAININKELAYGAQLGMVYRDEARDQAEHEVMDKLSGERESVSSVVTATRSGSSASSSPTSTQRSTS